MLGSEEFFFLDLATVRYLAANPVDGLVSVAKVVNLVTDGRFLAFVVALVTVVAIFRRRRLALALAACAVGQWIIVEVAAALVNRIPPGPSPLAPRIDYGFPSEHVALVSAIAVVAAWSWGRSDWMATVRRYGIAVVVIAITAAARVILVIDYPSDTIAAAAVVGLITREPQPFLTVVGDVNGVAVCLEAPFEVGGEFGFVFNDQQPHPSPAFAHVCGLRL